MIYSCLPVSFSGQVSVSKRITYAACVRIIMLIRTIINKEEVYVMKKSLAMLLAAAVTLSASPVFAEATEAVATAATGGSSTKVWFYVAIAIAAAFGMAIAAVGTGLAQSNAIRGAVEGIARNPSASSKIFTTMLIGIAMIESLAIYVLVVALILIFVWHPVL